MIAMLGWLIAMLRRASQFPIGILFDSLWNCKGQYFAASYAIERECLTGESSERSPRALRVI